MLSLLLLLSLELALSDLLQLTDSRRRTARAKKEKRSDFTDTSTTLDFYQISGHFGNGLNKR
jgi:hypothetical protein